MDLNKGDYLNNRISEPIQSDKGLREKPRFPRQEGILNQYCNKNSA